MKKTFRNPQQTKTGYKLLKLNSQQIALLRQEGFYVPLNDFSLEKVGFNTLDKDWPLEKKVSYAKRIMEQLGISFILESDETLSIAVDYNCKALINAVPILTEEHVGVRKPEERVPQQNLI
jgi:hypothetical protein